MLSLNNLKTLMYAKVFAQIYDGTLCTKGPWEALVTFQQFLVLADPEGNVDMTAEAISRRTTIPLKIIEKGIEALLQPDPKSRTPAEEGRRLIPLSEGRTWGWRVVNYKHYRELKREEDRREYHRNYWHQRKLNNSTETQHPQQNQPIEVDSRQETKALKPKVPRHLVELPDWLPKDQWQAYLEMRQRIRKAATPYAQNMAIAKLAELKEQGFHPAAILGQSIMNSWQGIFPLKVTT